MPLDWDASSNMFIAVAAPTGGLGSFPALLQGDVGPAPTIDTAINVTFLEPADATPNSASWTETSPDVYRLNLVIHKGPQGDPGDTLLTPSDYAGAAAGKILIIDPTNTSFIVQYPKVGGRFSPASLSNAPAGNINYTLGTVSVPAQSWDWRPEVSASTVITGTTGDVRVDLVARLNDEVSGNIVGRGIGYPSAGFYYGNPLPFGITLASGPPANASINYDKVLAGAAATIYLRAERVAGAGTFTTLAVDTHFNVWVRPLP